MRRKSIYIKIKGQASLMELLFGFLIILMVLISINFLIDKYYASKISKVNNEISYKRVSLLYKILQSDQLFSISTTEKGSIDLYKLEALNEKSDNCDYLLNVFGKMIGIKVIDLEKKNNICNSTSFPNCNTWEICINKKKYYQIYSIYVNIYDPINRTNHIALAQVYI